MLSRLEVAFKTGKGLRQSDGLRKTVPDRRTGNRKSSVSKLGSCPWNNGVFVAGGTKTLSCWVATGRCNRFSQVHGAVTVMNREHQECHLVLDLVSDWQPVELLQLSINHYHSAQSNQSHLLPFYYCIHWYRPK